MASTSSEEITQIVLSRQLAATTQEAMLKLNLRQLTSSSDCAGLSSCWTLSREESQRYLGYLLLYCNSVSLTDTNP